AQKEFERLRTEQNEASKQIGKLKDPAEKQSAISRVGDLKSKVKEAEERMKSAEAELAPLLLMVPQPPDDDVPVGRDASENVVLYRWETTRKFQFKPQTHLVLRTALNILDFETGVRLESTRS